ncbi:UNKNOWN [Stylonychia lemnae]|uniref:Uncharacterized protein n=1 Tax=Stylonychia lemnae TaxID=5949 RepID=A0A078AH89_STYLE|nr:UNKNOWN [Stylonychia lemnae]|eukprot:CDW81201.1 UNKNOWN [Stylonychia lemnae]
MVSSKKVQLGLFILSLWFLVQAFEAAYYNGKHANNLSAQYLKTHTKYQAQMRKLTKKYTKYEIKMPEPEIITNYKNKISYGVAYFYLVGGLCLAFQVKFANVLLIPIHLMVSVLQHNPELAERDAEYQLKVRQFLLDGLILAALITFQGVKFRR